MALLEFSRIFKRWSLTGGNIHILALLVLFPGCHKQVSSTMGFCHKVLCCHMLKVTEPKEHELKPLELSQIKPFFILRKLSQVLCYSNRKLTITKDWEKKLTDTQYLFKYFLTFLIFGLPHTMVVSGQDQEGRQPPSTEDSGKCVFVYSRRQFWVHYTYNHQFSFHFWILWILNPGIHWATPIRDTKSHTQWCTHEKSMRLSKG